MMLRVRSGLPRDIDRLNKRLRAADLQEIQAVTGEDSRKALEQGMAWSDPCLVVADPQDRSLALFGVVPDPGQADVGRVWLLGTDDLVSYSHAFLRNSRKWIEKLHERYPTLWNYVDARNEVHIRWLKWCGFTFLRRIEEYGVERRPFYEFERVAGKSMLDKRSPPPFVKADRTTYYSVFENHPYMNKKNEKQVIDFMN